MPIRLAPQGLIGHVILVLVGAILLELLASAVIFEMADIHGARTMRAGALADKLVVVTRVIESTPSPSRTAVAAGLSSDKSQVRWLIGSEPHHDDGEAADRLARDLRQREPILAKRDIRVIRIDSSALGENRMAAAVRLGDGSWIEVTSRLRVQPYDVLWAAIGSAIILSVTIIIIALILLRSMGSPLRTLARAADSVGHGESVHVPVHGAGDLRQVANAFNAMQDRINGLLHDRTQALAAAGHDLRTPLSRIRLRASLVADPTARKALEDDVDEMIGMLDSLLAYFGGQHEGETRRPVDLAALCITLVDAASDAGRAATYAGPERLVSCVPSSSVRRAVDNLIQNALHYGEQAAVSLHADAEHIVIRVEDQGPGIPQDRMAWVREPFARLDDARARNTSGMGLGLSIVHRVAQLEGGDLVLANRMPRGLRAELRLPHRPAT